MKSGLEGRNNLTMRITRMFVSSGLNEVRPRRPEQLAGSCFFGEGGIEVSMKSGLEGRNNQRTSA